MALQVYRAAAVAANTPFTFVVPGQRTWRLLSVCATLSRAVGGTPTRALTLTIVAGPSTIMASAAADAGTEPGALTVTWANGQPAAVSSGTTGVTLGPLPVVVLHPGYVITGTVVNGAAADQWTAATAWVDERAT